MHGTLKVDGVEKTTGFHPGFPSTCYAKTVQVNITYRSAQSGQLLGVRMDSHSGLELIVKIQEVDHGTIFVAKTCQYMQISACCLSNYIIHCDNPTEIT